MSEQVMFIVVRHPDVDDDATSVREALILCGKGVNVEGTLLGGDTPELGSAFCDNKAGVDMLPPGTYVGNVDKQYNVIDVRHATDAEILSIGRGRNPL